MRTGDFHRTGSEIGIGVVVGDNRDQTAMFLRSNRNFAEFAYNRGIARIIRVHRNRPVSEHGFRTRCGDRYVVPLLALYDIPVFVFLQILICLTACQRILEVPHVTGLFDILDLKIRDRRLEMRVPVHEPFSPKNQTLIV